MILLAGWERVERNNQNNGILGRGEAFPWKRYETATLKYKEYPEIPHTIIKSRLRTDRGVLLMDYEMPLSIDTYARLSNACMLFGIARDAYERTKGGSSNRLSGQRDAVVAVVFSAAALEAFINEVGGIADGLIQRFVAQDPDSVKQYAALWKEVERLQRSIAFEYLLASTAFSGQPYDKGTGPYQDFELLIKLRNALVHFEPDHGELPAGPPRIIQSLRSKNILAESLEGEDGPSWITLIMTRAVARWACNTSANLVGSVLEFVPESVLKKVLKRETARFFQPLD